MMIFQMNAIAQITKDSNRKRISMDVRQRGKVMTLTMGTTFPVVADEESMPHYRETKTTL